MTQQPLHADALVDASTAATGLDDFDGVEWREGLDVLVQSLNAEGRLHDLGRAVVESEVVDYLTNRLRIVDWARGHPSEVDQPVVAPIVIVGQARTGTTILFDLLSLDPRLRAPLTWQIEQPFPPPVPAGVDDDPRIDAVDERLSAVDMLIPEFRQMHPMGARMPQECVRMFYGDFRSAGFPIQYRVPSYAEWLFNDADMSSAYRYHGLFLRHLASRWPTDRWVLKSPAHIWALDAMLSAYPDALLVQTHRDPLRTFASLASMFVISRRLGSEPDDIDAHEIARDWATYVSIGLDRSVAARRDGIVAPGRVVDLQFVDFMADPFSTIKQVYALAGMALTAEVEAAMRDFLLQNSKEQRADHRYTWADTRLGRDEWSARIDDYVTYFDVPTEDFA